MASGILDALYGNDTLLVGTGLMNTPSLFRMLAALGVGKELFRASRSLLVGAGGSATA